MSALHRHETASVGLRAPRLTGEGREHGRLVRLILLSYTRWPGQPKQDPWPCDATLAARAGLSENEVERAMARLRAAGILTTRWGKRPGAKPGRLIALDLHAPCKALAPEGFAVRNLWAICRSIRARPAALVTMMVGAYMLASDAAGEEIEDWAELDCSASALRRFVGQADNSSWTKRLRELEALGLIRREGRRVEVSPPRVWFSLAVDVAERDAAGIAARCSPTSRIHAHVHAPPADRQSRVAGQHPTQDHSGAARGSAKGPSGTPVQYAGPAGLEAVRGGVGHGRAPTRPRSAGAQDSTFGPALPASAPGRPHEVGELVAWEIGELDPSLWVEVFEHGPANTWEPGVFLSPPQRLARVERRDRLADAPEVEVLARERPRAAGDR